MSLIPFPFGQSYRWPLLAFVALLCGVFDLVLLRLTEKGVSLKTTVEPITQGDRCHPRQCSLCVCGDIRPRARSEIVKACDTFNTGSSSIGEAHGMARRATNPVTQPHFSMHQGYVGWRESTLLDRHAYHAWGNCQIPPKEICHLKYVKPIQWVY